MKREHKTFTVAVNYNSARYLVSWVHKGKESYEMPNHTHFLSAWRLSGSCLANHQGNGNIRRWERPAAMALSTITDFNSLSWKQEQLAYSTLMKSWGLVCSHVWGLNPWRGAWSTVREQWETVEHVLSWAPSLWLIPSVFLKVCFTDAPSGNIHWCLINMHTVQTSSIPLIVIYGARAKEPEFLTCSLLILCTFKLENHVSRYQWLMLCELCPPRWWWQRIKEPRDWQTIDVFCTFEKWNN